jgi:hypothetical protein
MTTVLSLVSRFLEVWDPTKGPGSQDYFPNDMNSLFHCVDIYDDGTKGIVDRITAAPTQIKAVAVNCINIPYIPHYYSLLVKKKIHYRLMSFCCTR